MIFAVMNAILSNCVEKPEKVRTSTGFEPVTSRYRCDAQTNWAMKPLTLGAGHLWVLMSPWRKDVEVLTFSGFSTQLLKIAFITAMIIAYLISKIRSSIYVTFHISLNFINWLDKPLFDEGRLCQINFFRRVCRRYAHWCFGLWMIG